MKREYRADPTLDLLRELGERHEQAYLTYLVRSGRTSGMPGVNAAGAIH